MFSTGEFISGLDNDYIFCNSKMLKAEVVYTKNYPVVMGIRILDHINKDFIGITREVENRESFFELFKS